MIFLNVYIGMNPEVDTSFLPDVDREEAENRLREQLRLEWVARQERTRMEDIEVTYSYWDGTGHRRSTHMKKGLFALLLVLCSVVLSVHLNLFRWRFCLTQATRSDSSWRKRWTRCGVILASCGARRRSSSCSLRRT